MGCGHALKSKTFNCDFIHLTSGNIINFVLDASLSDKQVRLFVNHPEDAKSGCNSQLYRELKWQSFSAHTSDIYDAFAQLPMVLAGSFHYYFTIDDR